MVDLERDQRRERASTEALQGRERGERVDLERDRG
jgi:hypothetical protein